jgi:hypothetical protein
MKLLKIPETEPLGVSVASKPSAKIPTTQIIVVSLRLIKRVRIKPINTK